jgi:hypothetical protein
MFCMALCLALSAQVTVALLDRVQHVLDIDHAPNAVAGEVVASQHHEDIHHAVPHHHDDGGAPQHDDHGAPGHHHSGDGVLAPWLAVASLDVTPQRAALTVAPHRLTPRPDAAERRRERPPKPALEA